MLSLLRAMGEKNKNTRGLLLTSVSRGSYSNASVGAEEGNTSQLFLLASLLSKGARHSWIVPEGQEAAGCPCAVRRASGS